MGDVPATSNAASICGDQGYLAPVTWTMPAAAVALVRELASTAGLGNVTANPHRSQDSVHEAFLASLARLERWLTREQIPYAVFGSVAASAWIDRGVSLDFDRPGARDPAERIPDI